MHSWSHTRVCCTKIFPNNSLLFHTQTQITGTICRNNNESMNQHFLLFPQCFLSYPEQILPFGSHLICCLEMLLIWTRYKNLLLFSKRNILLFSQCFPQLYILQEEYSLFLTMFFHSYISLVRQNAALCGNGLNIDDKNAVVKQGVSCRKNFVSLYVM